MGTRRSPRAGWKGKSIIDTGAAKGEAEGGVVFKLGELVDSEGEFGGAAQCLRVETAYFFNGYGVPSRWV
jgi:hypothetical protein